MSKYSVEQKKWGEHTLFELHNADNGEMVQAADMAGSITRLVFAWPDGSTHDVLFPHESPEHLRDRSTYAGAAVLSLAGRVPGSTVRVLDENRKQRAEYALPVKENGDPFIHGFSRYSRFTPVVESLKADDNAAQVILAYETDERYGQYPKIRLEVSYVLGQGRLDVRSRVMNLSDKPVPVATGHHASFLVPAQPEDARPIIDDLELTVYSDQMMELGEDKCFTGKVVDVSGTDLDFTGGKKLGGQSLDNVFLFKGDKPGAGAELYNPAMGKGVRLGLGRGYRTIVVWSHETNPPYPKRRFLAMEPCSHVGASMSHPEVVGQTVLAPGREISMSWWAEPV